MHRRALLDLLARYAKRRPGEQALVRRFEEFVRGHEDCLSRSCRPGHLTASAWILSPCGEQVLLTHHKKLGKWLQLGGHVDGEPQVERACLREAQEESGMQRFSFVSGDDALTPLDLDVHAIPARAVEPEHLHWDVRFLLQAAPAQPLVCSDESNRLEWVEAGALSTFTQEESVLRLHRKAVELRR